MATSTHTAAPGGKPPFPPFQQETFASQLLWFALFFIALYLLMSRLAIPRIGGILEARSRRVADDLAQAAKLKEEADATLAAYEKELADARARAQALAQETRDRLNAEAEQARKVLEAELNAKLAEADRTIAVTKQAAMANVSDIAIETATAIVERLIGTVPARATVDAAVADVLKR